MAFKLNELVNMPTTWTLRTLSVNQTVVDCFLLQLQHLLENLSNVYQRTQPDIVNESNKEHYKSQNEEDTVTIATNRPITNETVEDHHYSQTTYAEVFSDTAD
jgi:hypothetical protein